MSSLPSYANKGAYYGKVQEFKTYYNRILHLINLKPNKMQRMIEKRRQMKGTDLKWRGQPLAKLYISMLKIDSNNQL